MVKFKSNILILLLAIHTHYVMSVQWDKLHCASDSVQEMPEGAAANIGRFPWLGVVQHSFYVGGKIQHAITGAVLIHPAFAIAAAEDIAKINPELLINNTKLILWGSTGNRHVIEVKDYILHPEFDKKITSATLALLDLIAWADDQLQDWKVPVLPICMPVRGAGTFNEMYAVKMNDANGTIVKEIFKMNYVEDQVCEEFYYKAQLGHTKMNPVNPLCAVSAHSKSPCVWDSGTALITRQTWGFWKLLGFAVRGPGCGAPTRFINIHTYLPWINDVISRIPYEDASTTYKLGYRRVNPYKLVIYRPGVFIPKRLGECAPGQRGGVMYKDSSELLVNKNFIQGFFFVVVTMMARFTCVLVDLQVSQQSNAAVWIEHNCHKDAMGLHHGFDRPSRERMTCFLYFKSAAYIEIRFYFSFKATVDVTVYGFQERKKYVPNPFWSSQHTTLWWPTPNRLKFSYFYPAIKWYWYM